jgi:hypothetical protein
MGKIIPIKKGDHVRYYDQEATVLIEPDEFGQLKIGLDEGEIWTFTEEIERLSTEGPILE